MPLIALFISGVGEFSAINIVIPAKLVPDSDQGAGIQAILNRPIWMPASAGMTGKTPRPLIYFSD
jgi:hypothetical protein